MSTADDYIQQVEARRAEKDEFFRQNQQSPIPPGRREGFDGLNYFPPDPDYRFELELDRRDDPETVTVETTMDGERDYLVWGEFDLTVGGTPVTLQAYKADPHEGRLWVPFRDETNGDETYGAGRYLDLEEANHERGGTWLVDFNLAYNPYCAYSDRYECPLIPMANWLDVRIEAGEKAYEAAASSYDDAD